MSNYNKILKGYSKMRKLLVLAGLTCVMNTGSLMANDYQHGYHHYHPEHENHYHSYDCTRNSRYNHHRSPAPSVKVSHYRPDTFGGINTYTISMTALLGRGVFGMAATPLLYHH